MPQPKSGANPPARPLSYDFVAALLSYLIPGMGQIYQGRIAKGLLFLVCIGLLFGYGVYLGQGQNVFLPDETKLPRVDLSLFRFNMEGTLKALYYRPQFCGQFWVGVAVWPAIWQYHSFDANKEEHAWLGKFQRQPKEEFLSTLQTDGDKTWDLGWVFTVIAGVLNIMVIYDALAGPAFRVATREPKENKNTHAASSAVAV
jgi:TM2 domain-containing membrane protein YozV